MTPLGEEIVSGLLSWVAAGGDSELEFYMPEVYSECRSTACMLGWVEHHYGNHNDPSRVTESMLERETGIPVEYWDNLFFPYEDIPLRKITHTIAHEVLVEFLESRGKRLKWTEEVYRV